MGDILMPYINPHSQLQQAQQALEAVFLPSKVETSRFLMEEMIPEACPAAVLLVDFHFGGFSHS